VSALFGESESKTSTPTVSGQLLVEWSLDQNLFGTTECPDCCNLRLVKLSTTVV
jgi:hypothetical protein